MDRWVAFIFLLLLMTSRHSLDSVGWHAGAQVVPMCQRCVVFCSEASACSFILRKNPQDDDVLGFIRRGKTRYLEDHPGTCKWLVTPFMSQLGHLEGEQPYLGNLLTMVINHLLNGIINHLLNGMLLQVWTHKPVVWLQIITKIWMKLIHRFSIPNWFRK